jgi:hypothetical protein
MDKNNFIEVYSKLGSIGKTAAYFGKAPNTIRYWCNKYGLEIQPSCMTIFQEIRETPMTNEQKSIVLGSVLGDGCLKLAPHSKNARLTIGHSITQLEYLKWKCEKLTPFSRKITLDQKAKTKIISGIDANSKDFYKFFTIAHPDVTDFYKRYVIDGKKRINKHIIDELDLVSLSILFADDGSVYIDKRNNVPTCMISTNSFNYDEQLILVEALRKFFYGTIKIDVQGNIGRNDLYIRMYRTEEIKKFLASIASILPECIHYKLHLQRLGVKPLFNIG